MFAGLSNSVLVECFKFQRSVGCKTSSFLLTTAPSSCDFLFSFVLLRRSVLLTRGRVHKNSNSFVTKKWERTCGLREGGNTCSVALLLCSVYALPQAYQMWRLRETISTDYCSVEYKLCQTAFQGDYSINTNGKRWRRRMKEILYIYIYIL